MVNRGAYIQTEKLDVNLVFIEADEWNPGPAKVGSKTFLCPEDIFLLSVFSSKSNFNTHDYILHSKAFMWTLEILLSQHPPLLWKSCKLHWNTWGLVWWCGMGEDGATGAILICQWHHSQLYYFSLSEYLSITAYIWSHKSYCGHSRKEALQHLKKCIYQQFKIQSYLRTSKCVLPFTLGLTFEPSVSYTIILWDKICIQHRFLRRQQKVEYIPSGLGFGFSNPPSCMSSNAKDTLRT